ncbi:MAG TPA: sugar phosphate isomerase/epimerase [Candidatus Dormibacteraeota bacterium]|nr:sugar phosphate isomerase/epimerase [Candidatus Dormibacteraeota bacterium]
MIGAELYTLREHLREPEAIAAGLNRVRTLGYEGVELAGLGPIEPARLATILRNTGLVACSAHVAWERLREDRDAAVEDCQTWGCAHMAVPVLPPAYRDASGYARFGLEAGEVAARLQEAGIRLSYHNHSFELERFGAENGLEILYRSSDPSLVRAQIDTYWIQYGGGNPAAWIRRLTGRLPSVHLKDMAVSGGAPVMAEIGEGNLDWPDVLAACSEAGVEWLIVEQDVCRRDPFESLAISRRNLAAFLSQQPSSVRGTRA